MLYVLGILLSAAIYFGQSTAGFLDSSPTQLKRGDSKTSVLTAVKVQAGLERRQGSFVPKNTTEHHYVDHAPLLRGASARFAKTSMRFKLPALDLEDIESQIEDIQCSNSVIQIEFTDGLVLRNAQEKWDGLNKFIVISSHPGCNDDGERAPYIVSNVHYVTDGATAFLSAKRMEWKAVYSSMKVDFGVTGNVPYGQYSISGVRSHENIRRQLGRRQAAPSSSVTFPSAPSVTPTSESTTHDIGFTNFSQALVSAGGITLGCKNCTTVGTLEITHGTFTVNSSANNEFEEAYQFIEHGFFNFVANGINAHIELDTVVSLTASFEHDVAVIALPGFQIPGIAAVGPQFRAILLGSVDITSVVNFTYGFDLSIPNGSSINLNIGNLTNSSSQGFSQSKITAIPLAASSSDLALTLSLGLRALFLLGVDILSNAGSMEAGAFLDLPTLSASISSVSNVNANCDPVNASSSVTGFLSHVFPKLINIAPSVNLDVELYASATLAVPPILASRISAVSIGSSVTITGTGFALQTACLSYDSMATAFVKPTFTSTTSTSAASSTGTGSDNSGSGGKKNLGTPSRDMNPFSQNLVMACALALILGFVIALAAL